MVRSVYMKMKNKSSKIFVCTKRLILLYGKNMLFIQTEFYQKIFNFSKNILRKFEQMLTWAHKRTWAHAHDEQHLSI